MYPYQYIFSYCEKHLYTSSKTGKRLTEIKYKNNILQMPYSAFQLHENGFL